MVTISSGSLVDSMAFDNKAQAEAAVEYFKLYYDEECYVRDIEISEITIDTNDYISKLNEYQKQYYKANKEKIDERHKQYYEANREKELERCKRRYKDNCARKNGKIS